MGTFYSIFSIPYFALHFFVNFLTKISLHFIFYFKTNLFSSILHTWKLSPVLTIAQFCLLYTVFMLQFQWNHCIFDVLFRNLIFILTFINVIFILHSFFRCLCSYQTHIWPILPSFVESKKKYCKSHGHKRNSQIWQLDNQTDNI